VRYLNGQLTQDLKKLVPGRALPACVTTAKGRLQADVWVTDLAGEREAIAVDAAPELQESLSARLERYIISDDVVMEDVTGHEGLLHCVGVDPAEHPLLQSFSKVQAARLGEDGWDVRVPLSDLDSLKTGLGGLLGSAVDWERIRVLRGIPAWGAELTEDTLPPEAGLERTHIDYHKGCYIGQEVISRLKSVGHVNRTLTTFRACAPGILASGDTFQTEAGVDAGVITSVVSLDEGHFLAMGYLKRGREERRFVSASGVALERI